MDQETEFILYARSTAFFKKPFNILSRMADGLLKRERISEFTHNFGLTVVMCIFS